MRLAEIQREMLELKEEAKACRSRMKKYAGSRALEAERVATKAEPYQYIQLPAPSTEVTNEQVLNGEVVDPFAVVGLTNRRHTEYKGPVHRVGEQYYILYQNLPLRVYTSCDPRYSWEE